MPFISKVAIENYKSIQKLELDLGRFNVFIGENGCGKSNLIEAMALASCAVEDKLDNEYLVTRGIRLTEPGLMRSAFDDSSKDKEIRICLTGRELGPVADPKIEHRYECVLQHNNEPFGQWTKKTDTSLVDALDVLRTAHLDRLPEADRAKAKKQADRDTRALVKALESLMGASARKAVAQTGEPVPRGRKTKANVTVGLKGKEVEPVQLTIKSRFVISMLEEFGHKALLQKFMIYTPSFEALRTFWDDKQVDPVGRNGEGLFRLLQVMNKESGQKAIADIQEALQVLGWFESFELPAASRSRAKSLKIRDRFLTGSRSKLFDQRSANEGFLYLLFYFTLLSSSQTPTFFAIENVDVALNPKLCEQIIIQFVNFAKKYEKQLVLTTHNPAILDGLDLDDDEQRLFVVSRNKDGHTKIKRYTKPPSIPDEKKSPVRLSEAFLKGYLGGLPKGF